MPTPVPSDALHPNHRPSSTLPVELRRTTVPPDVRDWVRRETGSAVVRWGRLPGASSTAVHGLVLADGRRLVLRRYVWPGFLEDEPEAPGREVDTLGWGRAAGLAVPEVVAADLAATVPALLMTWLPGRAVASPDPHLLAEAAAAVHDVDSAGLGHQWFPWYADPCHWRRPPPEATWPALWDRAIELWQAASLSGANARSFIHRDFHPGNVLWQARPARLGGIVDWANACDGPPGCDVATCGWNLEDWAGPAAAAAFRSAYETLTGRAQDPFWELGVAMEHGPDDWSAADLARAEPRLAAALSQIGGLPRRPRGLPW